MYLHGWIDQAVLEIIDSDLANNLIDKMIVYRPDQGGNSGLLYIDNVNLLYVFEISF